MKLSKLDLQSISRDTGKQWGEIPSMQLSACPKLERASAPAQSQLSISSYVSSNGCVKLNRQKQSSLLSPLIFMTVCLTYSLIVKIQSPRQLTEERVHWASQFQRVSP